MASVVVPIVAANVDQVLIVFAAATGVIMIRLEDKELEQRFGEEYRRYRNHVPALIPTLWKPGFSGQGLKGDS